MLNRNPAIRNYVRATPFFSNAFALTQGKRPSIEDYDVYYHDESVGCVIVGIADGHGGHQIAEWMNKHWPKQVMAMLAEEVKRNPSKDSVHQETNLHRFEAILACSIYNAERHLFSIWKQLIAKHLTTYDSASCPGTTITATVWWYKRFPLEAILVNVGDSQTLALDQKGRLIKATHIHKPTDRVELDRIHAAGRTVVLVGPQRIPRVDGGLALSRALGDFTYKVDMDGNYMGSKSAVCPKPSIIRIRMNPKEKYYFFSYSDGLLENDAWTDATVLESLRLLILKYETLSNLEVESAHHSATTGMEYEHVNAWKKKGELMKFAAEMIVTAESRSMDNVSCQITCIDPSKSPV